MPRKPPRRAGRPQRTTRSRKTAPRRAAARSRRREAPKRKPPVPTKKAAKPAPPRQVKAAAKAKPTKAAAKPTRSRPATAPRVEPTIVPSKEPVDPAEQSARWHAYEMLIHRIETIAGAPLEKIYESLDTAGMKGRGFSDIVEHVSDHFSISYVDAATVVQGYPGHSGPETEFRAFLRRRRQLARERMRGDQPWFA